MANVTYADLSEATTVVDTDLLASYRGAGPLKRLFASTLKTYMGLDFLKLDASNGPLTGALGLAVGSVGSPGLSFASDADTGFYWISANKYGVATGGVLRGFWDSTGYTASAPLNYAAVADVASATTTDIGAATSNYVRITGTTAITGLGTAAVGVVRIVRFAGALTLTYNASSLILPGATDITTAAGDMAKFVSEGSGNWRCEWYSKASGLPTSLSGGVYTGGAFNGTLGATTPSSVAATTVAASGLISANGGQIAFPATQVPSAGANTLDDYEEGTFNVTFTATTPPTGVTYSSRQFTYVKIGRQVTISGRLTLSSKGTGGVGNVNITGLPFAGSTGGDSVAVGYYAGLGMSAGNQLGGYISSSTIQPVELSNTAAASLQWSATTDSFDMMFAATYIAAS